MRVRQSFLALGVALFAATGLTACGSDTPAASPAPAVSTPVADNPVLGTPDGAAAGAGSMENCALVSSLMLALSGTGTLTQTQLDQAAAISPDYQALIDPLSAGLSGVDLTDKAAVKTALSDPAVKDLPSKVGKVFAAACV